VRRIESLFLEGPVGRLEALLEEPEDAPAREAALVCHPHPQHGGTMHNKVVYRIARGLRRGGAAVLRFNYRGVNLSEGSYAAGVGELEDARAALSYLRGRYPELPYTLAGFSFGSRIVLQLGCGIAGAAGPRRVIAVGFPASDQDRAYLDRCTVPLLVVQSTHDQYCSVEKIESLLSALKHTRLVLIDAQDHFFAGALEKLEEVVAKPSGA
jgi:alpha/beta superfamily hydrolase